jgi:uncharacterized YccA/Bax inhibitor family protein
MDVILSDTSSFLETPAGVAAVITAVGSLFAIILKFVFDSKKESNMFVVNQWDNIQKFFIGEIQYLRENINFYRQENLRLSSENAELKTMLKVYNKKYKRRQKNKNDKDKDNEQELNN